MLGRLRFWRIPSPASSFGYALCVQDAPHRMIFRLVSGGEGLQATGEQKEFSKDAVCLTAEARKAAFFFSGFAASSS